MRIEFVSSPGQDEMIALMTELDRLDNSELRLFTLEKAQMLLSTAQVREGAELVRGFRNQPRKVAIVAPDNISYGISRIFKVFRESDSTALEVFRDEAAAKSWLLDQDPGADPTQ